jgi:ABC-type oligopeptide transport system substrate-binding subunit
VARLVEDMLAIDGAGLGRAPQRLRPGRRLTLLVPTGSHEAEVAARTLADELGRAGVPMEIVTGDLPLVLLRLRHGAFDGALLEWNGRDDEDLAALFHARAAQNYGGFASREVDALLDELGRPDCADRRAARAALAQRLLEESPALFLYAPDDVYLYGARLRSPRLLGDFFPLRDVGP